MKKNQSLIAGIRFLAIAFLVFSLGIGLGNSVRNKSLLVEAPSQTIVSQDEEYAYNAPVIEMSEHTKAILNEVNESLFNAITSKMIAYAPENAIDAKYLNSRRHRQDLSNNFVLPTVRNNSVVKPPRSDMICVNTS